MKKKKSKTSKNLKSNIKEIYSAKADPKNVAKKVAKGGGNKTMKAVY